METFDEPPMPPSCKLKTCQYEHKRGGLIQHVHLRDRDDEDVIDINLVGENQRAVVRALAAISVTLQSIDDTLFWIHEKLASR